MLRLSSEKGYSVIELLVSSIILSVTVATAIPNYNAIRTRVADSVALSDYRNTKTAVFSMAAEEVDTWSYYYLTVNATTKTGWTFSYDGTSFSFNSWSLGDPLPAGFEHLSFSDRTIPLIVYSYYFPSTFGDIDYKYIWIDHERSAHSYRYVKYQSPFFNIDWGDQVIDK